MIQKRIFLTLLIFLCLSYPVYPKEIKDDSLSLISSVDFQREVISYKENISLSFSKELIKIRTDTAELKLDSVSKMTEFKQISGRETFKGSDIIGFKEISLKQAEITLKKYFYGNSTLLYSKDGRNFTRANIPYFQNSSHVWFNTTSFSSFTLSMPDIYIFPDIDAEPFLYLDDYTEIETNNIMTYRFYNEETETTSFRDVQYDGLIINHFPLTTYQVDGETMIYSVTADETSLFTFIPQSEDDYSDGFDGNRFSIYDCSVSPCDFLSGSGEVGVFIKETFVEPIITIDMVTHIEEDKAWLWIYMDFKDLNRVLDYYQDLYLGDMEVVFYYREGELGAWTYTDQISCSHNSYCYVPISELEPGTYHTWGASFLYKNPVTNENTQINTGIGSFTTEGISEFPAPSIEILSPIKSGLSATMRADISFNGYTENDVYLRFQYRESGAPTWSEMPSAPSYYYVETEGIYSSDSWTELSYDTDYEYRAVLYWDSLEESQTTDWEYFNSGSPVSLGDLADDLISYYKLDESSGEIVYDSVGENDGTINGATYTSSGKIDGAYVFDTGEYIYISDSVDFSFTDGTDDLPFSFCSWIYPTTLDTHNIIFSKNNKDVSGTREYQMQLNSGKPAINLYGQGSTSTGINAVSTTTTLSINNWHHICFLYTGSKANTGFHIFVDGVNISLSRGGSGSYLGMSDTEQDLKFGVETTSYFKGRIDEVGIWDRVLSSDEISELWNDGDGLSLFEEVTPSVFAYSPLKDFNSNKLYKFKGSASYFVDSSEIDGLYFQHRLQNTTIFTRTPETDYFEITNNSVYTLEDYVTLDLNSKYEYRAVLSQDGSLFYSDFIYIETEDKIFPSLYTLEPINIGSGSAVLRGEGEFLDYEDIEEANAFFRYREYIPALDEFTIWSENINTQDFTGDTSTGTIFYNLSGLSANTTYQYVFMMEFYNGTGYTIFSGSPAYNFTTGIETLPKANPLINNVQIGGSDINDTSALLRGNIKNLGDYDTATFFWRIEEDGTGLWSERICENEINSSEIPEEEFITFIVTCGVYELNHSIKYNYIFYIEVFDTGFEIFGSDTLTFTTLGEGEKGADFDNWDINLSFPNDKEFLISGLIILLGMFIVFIGVKSSSFLSEYVIYITLLAGFGLLFFFTKIGYIPFWVLITTLIIVALFIAGWIKERMF